MDGYVRFNTDENGKILDVWDAWYKDLETEDFIDGGGIENYLRDDTYTPDSLLLVTFNLEEKIHYHYEYENEYDVEFIIENEIVLIKDYNYEDLQDIDDRNEEVEEILMEWRPND